MSAAGELADRLGMRAHPEGGWYVETWQPTAPDGSRGPGSAILFLLAAGERSHWHRLDADEIWQWSAGDDLELRTWTEGEATIASARLGGNVTTGETVVQALVPARAWQSARTLGEWTLVGCIVAPAFEFDGFELAAPDWEPPVDSTRDPR
ncbi:MAG: cupin domain-containing protein [Chloroflexota bacterium]